MPFILAPDWQATIFTETSPIIYPDTRSLAKVFHA
jgi:hypothetical protein